MGGGREKYPGREIRWLIELEWRRRFAVVMENLIKFSGKNALYNGKAFHHNPSKRMRISGRFTAQGEEPERPSIESFPDECLFEIFRRLTGQERSVSACVSKRWLCLLSSIRRSDICNPDLGASDHVNSAEEAAVDGCLSRSLDGKKATDLRLLAIAVGTSSRGGLGKLSILGTSSFYGVTDFGISGIACGCPALKSLSLWNVPYVSDKGLCDIAKWCPHLEKLNLCHCQSIVNQGLIAIAENCPKLSSLGIDSCSSIGNEGLQAILQGCTKLEMISIKDCPLIGDQGIASLSSSSSLTKMKLDGLSISDFSLAAIGQYGNSITHLSLINLNSVSENGFCIMGNAGGLQSLVSLVITSCLGITDVSFESIAKGCISLKQVSVQKCDFVSDVGLFAFSKSAVSLENLHLEEVNMITLYGIISALSVCKSKLRSLSLVSCLELKDTLLRGVIVINSTCRSLRSLSIKNCPGFGSAGITILGKLCPEVSQLNLNGLYGVTDEGFISFLNSSEGHILKLDLNGCLNLSDTAVAAVVRNHGQSIKIMNVEGCRKLSDFSLFAIAEHCELLQDLYMSYCAITDLGIAALLSARQLKLEILSFLGCHGLTDKCVPLFMKMQESLYGLNFKFCSSISSRTIELLEDKLWRCDLLY
ncbi:hypothetical protein V2J09_010320 [Rumex salicifolius]